MNSSMLTSKPRHGCHVTAMNPGEAVDSCFLIAWFKTKWSLEACTEACTEACMETCTEACSVGQSGAGHPLNSSDLFITSLMPAFLPVGSSWAEWLQYPNPTSRCGVWLLTCVLVSSLIRWGGHYFPCNSGGNALAHKVLRWYWWQVLNYYCCFLLLHDPPTQKTRGLVLSHSFYRWRNRRHSSLRSGLTLKLCCPPRCSIQIQPQAHS